MPLFHNGKTPHEWWHVYLRGEIWQYFSKWYQRGNITENQYKWKEIKSKQKWQNQDSWYQCKAVTLQTLVMSFHFYSINQEPDKAHQGTQKCSMYQCVVKVKYQPHISTQSFWLEPTYNTSIMNIGVFPVSLRGSGCPIEARNPITFWHNMKAKLYNCLSAKHPLWEVTHRTLGLPSLWQSVPPFQWLL